jgi:hypothetical protein
MSGLYELHEGESHYSSWRPELKRPSCIRSHGELAMRPGMRPAKPTSTSAISCPPLQETVRRREGTTRGVADQTAGQSRLGLV